jgi:hypothetical protein
MNRWQLERQFIRLDFLINIITDSSMASIVEGNLVDLEKRMASPNISAGFNRFKVSDFPEGWRD